MTINAKKRSELRAEAHTLSPVVIIGDKGLTDTVVTEIDRSLRAHELIKVKAYGDDRKVRAGWMKIICERLAAEAVQEIGKVLVIYRANPEKKLDPGSSPRRGARDDKAGSSVRDDKPRGSPRGDAKRFARDEKKREPRGVKVPTRDYKAFDRSKKDATRTSRPQSRTPSPRPESEPPRRRPRTSR